MSEKNEIRGKKRKRRKRRKRGGRRLSLNLMCEVLSTKREGNGPKKQRTTERE